MNNKNTNILENITFKTTSYRKNYDVVNLGDNIITEQEGIISLLRLYERKKPLLVGEFNLSLWNLDLANQINVDILQLMGEMTHETIYKELYREIKHKSIDISKYNKILTINTIIVGGEYRNIEVFDEFIEFIYRDYYDEKTLIVILALPFQYNIIDEDYYRLHRKIKTDADIINAVDYYSLNKFYDKTDAETNEYKIFNIVSQRGFNRINNSYLFEYHPKKTINRINNKNKTRINKMC